MSDSSDVGEIVNEFLVESYEGLDQLDRDLVALEQQGTDAALLGRIFRCVHTVKGTCGFLGFQKLESVTHVGENLLAKLRDGALDVTPALTSALLGLVDAIREMLGSIETTGAEGDANYDALVLTLTRIADGRGFVTADVPAIGAILVQQGDVAPADVAAALDEQREGNASRVGEILVARGVTSASAVSEALEVQNDASVDARVSSAAGVADASIRVDVSLLDRLMTLVGELVLARNQILQSSVDSTDLAFAGTTQRLNLITTELQEGVMKTRMQPIGNIWSKFPRVVRDLAIACEKQVVIAMEGAETELDKTIVEAIKDPLTHIVRNSVDHGIERPAVRVANGKSPEGRLFLRAFHEGGKVNIEIRDDGGGIDVTKLKAKALEKGLITAEAAAKLNDREALNLIFAPGLSTARAVTNVSGRGVGMDVVKTNVEQIGGTVDVSSVLGQGTTLRIRIPLTLAIIPGLIVTTGGNRYAIPQVSLLELVRLEGDEAKKRIEHIYGAPVYRLRGKLLPLIHLNHVLGLTDEPWNLDAVNIVNIVVLQAEGTSFGMVVDTINDTEEIVVKPLGKQLKSVQAFAGATIMGDGRVALILDVLGLAHMRGILSAAQERANADGRQDGRVGDVQDLEQLLLFSLGANQRVAFPLSAISRLEEFPSSAIERTGRHEVVQYRDEILPLIRLDQVLDGMDGGPADGDTLRVIVYVHGTTAIGFVVDQILDVVETSVHLTQQKRGRAVAGSTIVQGKVTDVIDVDALMAIVDREMHSQEFAHA
ncbi:MAG: chemotaxis protein CheW [Gemmatimonadota bacterium]